MLLAIDTFKLIKELEKSGLKEETSKVIVETFVEIQEKYKDGASESIAQERDGINKDINNQERRLVLEIRNLEQRIDAKIDILEDKMNAMENRIIIKMGGMIALAIALITWLNKFI